MFCINCYHPGTKVTNTRPHKKQPSIWRRRHCGTCGITFTTLESPDVSDALQLHDSKTNKPMAYQKGTLLLSLASALQAAGGSPSDAYWLTETVEQQALRILQVQKSTVKSLETDTLHNIAYDTLSAYHAIAGLSYGATHGIVRSGTQKRRPGRPRKY